MPQKLKKRLPQCEKSHTDDTLGIRKNRKQKILLKTQNTLVFDVLALCSA